MKSAKQFIDFLQAGHDLYLLYRNLKVYVSYIFHHFSNNSKLEFTLLVFLVYYSMNLIDAIVEKKLNNSHFTFIEIEKPPNGKRKKMYKRMSKSWNWTFSICNFVTFHLIVSSFVATEPWIWVSAFVAILKLSRI